MAEASNNIKNYEPGFRLGFPLPVSLLDTTGATSGQVPSFNGTTVVWSSAGSFSLPIITNLGGGRFDQYDQSTDILGIGLVGLIDGYSDNNFATDFTGMVAGDFTGLGGESNAMIIGYIPLGPGGNANINIQFDKVANEGSISIGTSGTGGSPSIDLSSTNNAIQIDFGSGNNYQLPNTAPGVGEVLGYIAPNQTGWVTVSGGSLTIGDPISGGTANRILFEDGSNNLAESSDFQFDQVTGTLIVSNGGSNHLLINPAGGQYYIGDGGGTANTTLIEVLDSLQLIRNWVNGQFLVQQINNGPRLIDGNTSTFNLYLGDVGSNINATVVEILDSLARIDIYAHSTGAPSTGLIQIGDGTSLGNSTMFQINDFARQVFVQTDGDFGVQRSTGQRVISTDFVGGTDYVFNAGDVNNGANGTKLQVLDSVSTVQVVTDGMFKIYNSLNDIYFYASPTSIVVGPNSSGNNTNFSVDDVNGNMLANLGGAFRMQNTSGEGFFQASNVAGEPLITIGDVDSSGNDTRTIWDDNNLRTDFYAQNFYFRGYGTQVGMSLEVTGTYAVFNAGDVGSNFNDTLFTVDDSAEDITATFDGEFRYKTTAGVTKLLVDLTNSVTSVQSSRFQMARGNNALTAANNLTIDNDGNTFFVDGNTQINLISNVNWQNGSELVLIFNGTPTLKHNQVASGSFVPMLLAGSVDFAVTAGTRILFLYTDSAWYELSRTQP